MLADEIFLKTDGRNEIETDWTKLAPKKVCLFIWKLRHEKLAVRRHLDRMGIDLHSLLCPRCNEEVETLEHAIFECKEVKESWIQAFKWWGIATDSGWNLQCLKDPNNAFWKLGGVGDKWKATIWSMAYLIWKHRNDVVFRQDRRKLMDLWFEFQLRIFQWNNYRSQAKKLS